MPAAAVSKIRGVAFEHESASFLLASRIGEAERHEVLQFAVPTSRLEKITAAAKQAKLDLDRDRASAALPPAPAAAGLASGVAATGPAGLAHGAAATGTGTGPAASDTAASAAPAADPPTESPLTSATPMLEISTTL